MNLRFLDQLSTRERLMVYAATAAVALFILYQFIYSPIVNKHTKLEKTIIRHSKYLQEALELKEEYESLTADSKLSKNLAAQRDKDFTIYSFLEKLAGETGIKNNIGYMKPISTDDDNSSLKISKVEMELKGITMGQLSSYLYGVESSKNMIIVSKLSVSGKGKDDRLINVVLQVETLAS